MLKTKILQIFLSKIASTWLVIKKAKVKANQVSKSRIRTMQAMYIRWKKQKMNTSKGVRNTIDIRVPGKYPDLQYQDTVFGGRCTITILLVQEIQPLMKMHASITHRDI